MSVRTEQVSANLQRLIADILTKEVEFPEMLVSVARVEITPNLKFAKIFVSVLPNAMRTRALNIIKREQRHITKELYKKLTMKFSPQLLFITDETEEEAYKIEKIITESNA